ncbi:MAG: Gfo/Idh/MocA family oxidoreductase [Phycisphaerae bacterium]|nr:Gfo/Idh/MocA family oxidoreductase [Phycisphaerae bacterium]
MIRLGMIGCGSHSTNVIFRSLQYAECEIAAAADLNADLLKRNSRLFNIGKTYDDYRRMLDGETLDGVCIVGPPALHHAAALETMARKIPTFIEKPPGQTLEQARELVEAQRASGAPLMVGFMKRFASNYVRAKALMDSDEFGPVSHVHVRYTYWPFSPLHEHLIYMSVHPLDLARFLGGPIKRMSFERHERDGEYVFAISLRYASGAVGMVNMGSQTPGVQERIEVCGTNSAVYVENLTHIEHLKGGRRKTFGQMDTWRPDLAIPSGPLFGVDEPLDTLVLQGYAGEMVHFVECIKTGQQPSPNIVDGLRSMELVDLLELHESGTFELQDA